MKARKLEKEVRNVEMQLRKKFGRKLVSIVQIGSSLRPKEMFSNSDVDFVVILDEKPKKRFVSVDSAIETSILPFSRWHFGKALKDGMPVAVMAVKFGKVLFDRNYFSKLNARPGKNTVETWMQNGLSIFSSAIMEFFAASCACCYLRDAHHSARSFLRAYILKKKGILCETDRDIIRSIDDEELRKIFGHLIKFRKNIDSFPFDFMKMCRMRGIRGRSAAPLLLLEKLAHKIIYLMHGKRMRTLAETIGRIKKPYDHIHSIYLTTRREGRKQKYLVSLVKKGDDMEFLEFPLYYRA